MILRDYNAVSQREPVYKITNVNQLTLVSKMSAPAVAAVIVDSVREKALADYRKKLLEHKELEARLKESKREWYFV